MKMKLIVQERLTLGNMLTPLEGNFATLKVIRKLRGDLSFSDEEFKKWEIKQVPGGDGATSLTWRLFDSKNKPIDQEAEIEIGEKATDVIVLALSKLNEQKKLKNQHFSLYEKFIENGAKSG